MLKQCIFIPLREEKKVAPFLKRSISVCNSKMIKFDDMENVNPFEGINVFIGPYQNSFLRLLQLPYFIFIINWLAQLVFAVSSTKNYTENNLNPEKYKTRENKSLPKFVVGKHSNEQTY